MKVLKYILSVLILGQSVLFSGCGDDSTESVILGTWLGTNIVRHSCVDDADNAGVSCPNDPESATCISCMVLKLERDGTYTLKTSFDSNHDNELGRYEAKNEVIRLEPEGKEAYDLPISGVTATNMTIELPRDGTCIATILLISSDCE